MIAWLVIGVLVLLFGAVALRGAPYVPTHSKAIRRALTLMPLERGDMVVDLGSGDGAFVKAAARYGLRAVGYELNPLLCVIAWLRCLPVRTNAQIKLRDYWLVDLPPDAKAIFVFLAGPHMQHLSRYLAKTVAQRTEPLYVVSYGFALPGYMPHKTSKGLYLYRLLPPKR